jgi:hypothetical protein
LVDDGALMMPAFAGRMPRPLFALDLSCWMSRIDVPPAALGWDRGFESGSPAAQSLLRTWLSGGASQHPLPRREGGQRGFQYQKVIVAEALRYPNLE